MFRSVVLLCIGLLVQSAAGQLFEGSCYLFYKNTSVEQKQPITVAFQSRSPDTCLKLCNLANQANAVLTCKSMVFDDKARTCSMFDSYGQEAGGKKVNKPGSDYYEFWPNCQDRLGQQPDAQLQLRGSNSIDSNLAVQKLGDSSFRDLQRLPVQSAAGYASQGASSYGGGAPASQPQAPAGGYGGAPQSAGGYGGGAPASQPQAPAGGYGGAPQPAGGYGGGAPASQPQAPAGGYGGSSGGGGYGGGAPASQPQAPAGGYGGSSGGGGYGGGAPASQPQAPAGGYGQKPAGYGGGAPASAPQAPAGGYGQQQQGGYGGGAPASQPQAPAGGGYGSQPTQGYGAALAGGYGGGAPASQPQAPSGGGYGAAPAGGYGGGAPASQPQAPSGGGYGAAPAGGYGGGAPASQPQPPSGGGYGAAPSGGYGAAPSGGYGAAQAYPPAFTPPSGGGYASTGGAGCAGSTPSKRKVIGESIQEIKKGDSGFDGTAAGCVSACCSNSKTKSIDFYSDDPIPCICNGKKCDDASDPAVCVDDDASQHFE